MDKLVEREAATRNPLVAAPALAVQFFLIPLTVVARNGGGVRRLPVAAGRRSIAAGLPGGDSERRVRSPLAGGVRVVAADGRPEGPRRPHARARRSSRRSRSRRGDPQVRRYLALAIGRLDPPLPADAVAEPDAGAGRPRQRDAHQRHLGAGLVGRRGRRAAPRCRCISAQDADAGIRKMVVYALGALPGDAQIDTLRTALQDSTPDVRWNAAVALARHGRSEGVRRAAADARPRATSSARSSATCARTRIRIRSPTS